MLCVLQIPVFYICSCLGKMLPLLLFVWRQHVYTYVLIYKVNTLLKEMQIDYTSTFCGSQFQQGCIHAGRMSDGNSKTFNLNCNSRFGFHTKHPIRSPFLKR